ncbi:MAG: glycoside hydrolase family 10 protein [Snowella sp.]|nr:glycoside hydrolase family 10 protein [Snowella sp.]
MNRFQRSLFLVILSVCVLLLTIGIQTEVRGQSRITEGRGVWLTNIDSDVLFDADKTKTGIDTLAKLKFNTLYPTIWNWGYTLYPSQVAKAVTGYEIDPTEGLQNRDVLQEIVTQGHQQKMIVIPWFEFGFMAPADSALARNQADWLTQKPDGNKIWLEGKTHERVWLNPLRPDVQKFISNLILEVVQNYDVDGIQLDDHFGYPADFGYDAFTLKLYQQDHAGKLPPHPPVLDPQADCVVADAAWQEWVNWRSQKITQYMTQLYQQIKAVKPDLVVSVSPNPQTFSKNCFLLDWQTWERRGLIEELALQVYRNQLTDFQRALQKPEVQTAKQHIPVIVGVLSGLKNRAIPMTQIQEQVQFIRQEKFQGASFFFYESLWNLGKESPAERQKQWQKLLAR